MVRKWIWDSKWIRNAAQTAHVSDVGARMGRAGPCQGDSRSRFGAHEERRPDLTGTTAGAWRNGPSLANLPSRQLQPLKDSESLGHLGWSGTGLPSAPCIQGIVRRVVGLSSLQSAETGKKVAGELQWSHPRPRLHFITDPPMNLANPRRRSRQSTWAAEDRGPHSSLHTGRPFLLAHRPLQPSDPGPITRPCDLPGAYSPHRPRPSLGEHAVNAFRRRIRMLHLTRPQGVGRGG